MRITRVAMFDTKLMDGFPSLHVGAAENDDGRRGVYHVPIGATAKGQIVLAFEVDDDP